MRPICSCAFAALVAGLQLAGCGGGTPATGHPPTANTITVLVSAGAPIKGAAVDVYVLDDATGLHTTAARTDHGLLGTATTNDTGTATISVPAPASTDYVNGPIQIVAHGAGLGYVDPSDPTTRISLPTDLDLTNTVSYATSQEAPVTVPVTLWTTLADAAALSYAQGHHSSSPNPTTILKAMAVTDPLMARHLSTAIAWDLRHTVPVSLTEPPAQSLRDAVLAALVDVALNQLARELSLTAAVTPGQVITAPTLVRDLSADLAADCLFDGYANAHTRLKTAGAPPYLYSASTTRSDLAGALDHWLALTANRSGLVRADLQSAGIFDALTLDTSILYPAGSTDQPFDHDPPSVILSVNFRGADALTRGPVGDARYVSGAVTVTGDASDPSGVASLTLKLAGNALIGDPNLSTTSHVVATIDATKLPDGPITITALAVDKPGNSGSTPLALTVDNIPPTIAVPQPLATAYYSASVPFDATATDAGAGVASLVSAGYTGAGLTDTDPTPAHLVGAWTVPTPIADGPYTAGSLTACDHVGNCSTTTPSLHIDRTPPVFAWAPQPPAATNADKITLSVTATDAGAGVLAAKYQATGTTPTPMTSGTPQWTADLFLGTTQGPTTILVWGEDAALDALGPHPNSGQGTAPPSLLTATVIRDTFPPTATYVPINYCDERNLAIATDGSGRAVVPVSYTCSAPGPIAAAGAHIYKAATRLAWTTAPTAAVLEGANPDNIPYLQFRVPYVAGTEAEITSAKYSVSLSCPTCTNPLPPAPTADLWLSPTQPADARVYDLPLSANLIPGLATITGPATLAVTLSLADAAGNTATPNPVTLTWHTIGPPLAITQDASYASVTGDLKASRHYRLADNTYATLFNAGALGSVCADNEVRLLRYLITNPAPVPVAFTAPLSGASWSIAETWSSSSTGALPSQSCAPSGHLTCAVQTLECCDPANAPPSTTTDTADAPMVTSAGVAPLAVYNQLGTSDAPTAITGQWTVPAATNGQPGIVAVYVGRPTTATTRSYQPNLPWTGSSYQYNSGQIWNVTQKGGSYCCDLNCADNCVLSQCGCASTASGAWTATGASYARTLTAAQDVVAGSMQLLSHGTAGTSQQLQLIGEDATMPNPVSLAATIPH